FELSFILHYNLKIENRGEHHSSMMFPSNLSMFFCTNTEKLAFEYRGVKRSPQDFYLFISLIAYIAAVLCCEKLTE
ncbi:hypothetical protein, partial [Enterococcus lactis]|uniref:hypothetical protein n=1 Tax=Enterococcus lactis TaxID=357441 RepID=UPI001E300803